MNLEEKPGYKVEFSSVGNFYYIFILIYWIGKKSVKAFLKKKIFVILSEIFRKTPRMFDIYKLFPKRQNYVFPIMRLKT